MNDKEIRQKLAGLVKEIIGLDMAKINPDKKINEIDEWDSFNNLMLIGEVEKSFSIKYTAQELVNILTVNHLVESIKTKLK
jgi:acyl carrier protein